MRKRPTPDPGLQQIETCEAWRLAGTLQTRKDDGLDEATIAREYPAKSALIVAAAAQLRVEYLANRSRGARP